MPAQPPFWTPTRMPAIGRSDLAMISLMRPAAASDSRITCGLGRDVGPGVAMALSPLTRCCPRDRGRSRPLLFRNLLPVGRQGGGESGEVWTRNKWNLSPQVQYHT